MPKAKKKLYTIGIPVYNDVDMLDVVAPYEMFNWMGTYWSQDPDENRALQVLLIAETNDPVLTNNKFQITPQGTFDQFSRKNHLNTIWVPGGNPDTLKKVMDNPAYMNFIKEQSAKAEYVTSVCVGALLLAHAGLLDGYKATTHWSYIPCLKEYPNVKVAKGTPRYVIDRNRVTGGGISSGLDESLKLVAMITGKEKGKKVAKQVQQVTQYYPDHYKDDLPTATECTM